MSQHLKVQKTIKLFIDGKFPRTESGRSYPCYAADGKTIYANLCQASRKDLRAAVEAAEAGTKAWSKATAYNRAQVLYRMAEMVEGKRAEFEALFKEALGFTSPQAAQSVNEAVDAFVYYSGWADKYQQVASSINPVSSPHHDFTTPEAVGVVALIAQDQFSFKKLVSDIAAIITSGNSVIVLLGKECPAILAPLAEVFATSDLPSGVINLLTGELKELLPHFASHMEIRSLSYQNEHDEFYYETRKLAVENMKRIVERAPATQAAGLKSVTDYIEYKTVWHPIGQ